MNADDWLGSFKPVDNVILGDCIAGMKQLPAASIDLIISDAPYGDDAEYGRNGKEIENNENPLLNCQMLFEAQRILKPNKTLYNFTNWKHYPFLTEFIMRYTNFTIRNMIVLNKSHFGMGYGFRNKHELILVLEKGTAVYNNLGFANVLDFEMEQHDGKTHPHKKPEKIIRQLLDHSTQKGDLVLDCFAGSGAVAFACKQMQRHYIGFEIDPKYYEMAKGKLKQTMLFDILGK